MLLGVQQQSTFAVAASREEPLGFGRRCSFVDHRVGIVAPTLAHRLGVGRRQLLDDLDQRRLVLGEMLGVLRAVQMLQRVDLAL